MADANKQPETEAKPVAVKKARYFVPKLGKTVEAESLEQVAEIVKKETSATKGKGETTKG